MSTQTAAIRPLGQVYSPRSAPPLCCALAHLRQVYSPRCAPPLRCALAHLRASAWPARRLLADARLLTLVLCRNFPKKARKGHEHAFRIDLASKDSAKCVKYVFSVADADELKLWADAFGAYSGMTQDEVDATLEGERLSDSDDEAEDDDEDDEEEGDDDDGDTFGDDGDDESFGVLVDGKEFRVSKMESMGAVKRRMSMSTGLTPEQMGGETNLHASHISARATRMFLRSRFPSVT